MTKQKGGLSGLSWRDIVSVGEAALSINGLFREILHAAANVPRCQVGNDTFQTLVYGCNTREIYIKCLLA